MAAKNSRSSCPRPMNEEPVKSPIDSGTCSLRSDCPTARTALASSSRSVSVSLPNFPTTTLARIGYWVGPIKRSTPPNMREETASFRRRRSLRSSSEQGIGIRKPVPRLVSFGVGGSRNALVDLALGTKDSECVLLKPSPKEVDQARDQDVPDQLDHHQQNEKRE